MTNTPSSFINTHAFKALLGKQSKNISEKDDVYKWDVNKKHHFTTSRLLTEEDIKGLTLPVNFHYLSEANLEVLKKHTKLDKGKNISVYYDLQEFTLEGSDNKKVRQSINKAKKYNLTIKDTFDNLSDIKIMLDEWSDILAQKYFRDFSGKNMFFFQKEYHKDCFAKFLYDGDKLVSFGVLSPNLDGHSSYVIGKALCNKYSGLSEYTDYLLYQEAITKGIRYVNLGQASKGLLFYKTKFPGAKEITHYDGTIESLKEVK